MNEFKFGLGERVLYPMGLTDCPTYATVIRRGTRADNGRAYYSIIPEYDDGLPMKQRNCAEGSLLRLSSSSSAEQPSSSRVVSEDWEIAFQGLLEASSGNRDYGYPKARDAIMRLHNRLAEAERLLLESKRYLIGVGDEPFLLAAQVSDFLDRRSQGASERPSDSASVDRSEAVTEHPEKP